jgi:hypothetical protein
MEIGADNSLPGRHRSAVQQPASSPTPRQSKPGELYTAGGSFGSPSSPSWMPRLEAFEIAGFGIRQQHPTGRRLTVKLSMKRQSASLTAGFLYYCD